MARADDRRRGARSRSASLRIDPAKRTVDVRRRDGADHLRRVRDPRRAGHAARAACSRATCCSRASGATPPTATRARSTCTSATCARSSSATPRSPEYLFTVRGVGYRFRDTDAAERTEPPAVARATASRCSSSLIVAGRDRRSSTSCVIAARWRPRLRDQKLDTLGARRRASTRRPLARRARPLARPQACSTRACAAAADASGARVDAARRHARARRALQAYLASDSTAQRDDPRPAVRRRRARPRAPARVARGTEAGDVGRVAEAALPLRLTPPGASARRVLRRGLLGAAGATSTPTSRSSASACSSRASSRCSSRCWPATCVARALSRARQAPGARRAAASPRATSRARFESDSARRARPARARRSTTCSSQLAELETARASSSSPPPRTSCARRSSRSAASSSCSRTRTSTRRRARPFLAPAARAGRPPGQARHRAARPVAAGGRARWSCAPSRPTSASWPRGVAAEFTPALAAHESHLELRLTGEPVEASAILSASPRSCAS